MGLGQHKSGASGGRPLKRGGTVVRATLRGFKGEKKKHNSERTNRNTMHEIGIQEGKDSCMLSDTAGGVSNKSGTLNKKKDEARNLKIATGRAQSLGRS